MDLNLGKLQIVLPVNPAPVEKGAAAELTEHIKKMTGQELTVICESETKKEQAYIYIGATDFAKANNITFPDNAFGEGWAIEAIGGDLESMWAVEDENPDKPLPFGVFCGERDRAGNPVSNLYGELRASDIIADGEYHLYKFQDLIAIKPLEGVFHNGTFHLFRNWLFQVFTLPFELEILLNKRVNFYLSMKVTGDVTCKDKNNLPAYSIDRVIIADPHADAC